MPRQYLLLQLFAAALVNCVRNETKILPYKNEGTLSSNKAEATAVMKNSASRPKPLISHDLGAYH